MTFRKHLRVNAALLFFSLFGTLVLYSHWANAGDWRAGLDMGFGAAGMDQPQTINQAIQPVSRAEGPGVATFFVENLISDTILVGAESSYGFRFSPFSAGVSFTGLTGRWYFWGPAPAPSLVAEGETTILSKRFTPFAGIASGITFAHIQRRNDIVGTVDGSGLYFGIKGGLDYPLSKKLTLRGEFAYNSTVFTSPTSPSVILEYAIQMGIYFFL